MNDSSKSNLFNVDQYSFDSTILLNCLTNCRKNQVFDEAHFVLVVLFFLVTKPNFGDNEEIKKCT